jgi:hypothetical protein
MLLVPADVLNPRRVDEHFAIEADAARAAGYDVALIDHDALVRGGDPRRAVAGVRGSTTAVYRGWMLSSQQYAAFAAALGDRGVRMRTTADQYRRGHELPGWYPALAELTPVSMWTVGTLGLPFVTVDLALRRDGVWRVVELGDGQVSDRPMTTPADDLISVLFTG